MPVKFSQRILDFHLPLFPSAVTIYGMDFLDAKQVASRIGLSVRAVTWHATRGHLTGRRVGRTWVFAPAAVERLLCWLEEHGRKRKSLCA